VQKRDKKLPSKNEDEIDEIILLTSDPRFK
jgi:hypothetical protein